MPCALSYLKSTIVTVDMLHYNAYVHNCVILQSKVFDDQDRF